MTLGLDTLGPKGIALRQELSIETGQGLDCGLIAAVDVQKDAGPVPGRMRDQEA